MARRAAAMVALGVALAATVLVVSGAGGEGSPTELLYKTAAGLVRRAPSPARRPVPRCSTAARSSAKLQCGTGFDVVPSLAWRGSPPRV